MLNSTRSSKLIFVYCINIPAEIISLLSVAIPTKL